MDLVGGPLAFATMSKRSTPVPRHAAIAALLVVTALVLTSCAKTRPTVEDWQPTWDRIAAAVPSESTIGENPSRTACSETLAFLRSNRADLFPTPDVAIDHTVTDWVEIAESAFFECPPKNAQVGSFAEAYGELLRLEREIESVLEMDRGS